MEAEYVTSVEALEEKFLWVDAALTGEERQARLAQFGYAPDNRAFAGLDPFSAAYRELVHDQYQELRGGWRYHEPTSEANPFDIDAFKVNPYPFNSSDQLAIGRTVACSGLILRDFPKKPGAKVLELGPGCGDLSLLLARSGYEVTGFDGESRYLDLIRHWAAIYGVEINTVEGQFSSYDLAGPFDAALFFESFHHAINHEDLLNRVKASLAPDGVLVFAGEPIEPEGELPWQLRTDSLATYCIRRNGWMELGFREDYFVDLLHRCGFYVQHRVYPDCRTANTFIGRPLVGCVPLNAMFLPKGWHAPETEDFRWSIGTAVLPVVERKALSVQFTSHNPDPITVEIVVDGDGGPRSLGDLSVISGQKATVELKAKSGDRQLRLKCPTWQPSDYGSADTRTLGIAVYAMEIS